MKNEINIPNFETHYSEDDWDKVKIQLGRNPHGLYRVEKYHPIHGHPMVISVVPFVKGAPFPTLYWLTCPILKKEISHVEKDGHIERFEKEFFSEGELLEELISNHENYRDERINLFENTIKDWSLFPEPMQEIIKKTGIGGMADFTHIKCFHLHYAHHLVRGNVVGRKLDEEFQISRFYQS